MLFNVLLARSTTVCAFLVKATTAITIRRMHLFAFLLVSDYFNVLKVNAVISVWVDGKARIERFFSSTII